MGACSLLARRIGMRAAEELILSGKIMTAAEMHKLGVLSRIIPEWEHLRCLVLHDLYHIYTVDEHSLMGIRVLELNVFARMRGGGLSHVNANTC